MACLNGFDNAIEIKGLRLGGGCLLAYFNDTSIPGIGTAFIHQFFSVACNSELNYFNGTLFRKNYRFRLSKNRIDGDYIINYRGRALLKVCSRSNCLSLAFLTKLTKAAPLLPVPVMSSPGTPSTSTSQLRHRLPPQPQSPEQSVYDIQQVQDDEHTDQIYQGPVRRPI